MKNILYISIILLLSSCFKEEDKRALNSSASVSILLGEDYGNVFYYNLATNTIVSQNLWSDWDLAFYAQEDDYYIKLNHGANMKAFNPESRDFESVTALDPNLDSKVDNASGNKEKHALQFTIKNSSNDTTYYNEDVYILLIGSNALGNKMGYKKISLLYTYLNQYRLKYANLDNTESHEITIAKDVTTNYVYFTFKGEGSEIIIEPDKTTWDLVFTRSTDETYLIDSSEYVPDYTVTSVLLNPYSSKAYLEKEDEENDYSNFNLNKIEHSILTDKLNIIGYNWKAYDLNTGIYVARPDQFYVIKDVNDFYYKMKFLSFYDPETNLKGTMSFKYEVIK